MTNLKQIENQNTYRRQKKEQEKRFLIFIKKNLKRRDVKYLVEENVPPKEVVFELLDSINPDALLKHLGIKIKQGMHSLNKNIPVIRQYNACIYRGKRYDSNSKCCFYHYIYYRRSVIK